MENPTGIVLCGICETYRAIPGRIICLTCKEGIEEVHNEATILDAMARQADSGLTEVRPRVDPWCP